MEQHWNKIQAALRNGSLGRRDFLATAAALGVSSPLTSQALAATPKRGGHLIMGLSGGSASDSLAPSSLVDKYIIFVGNQIYDSLTTVDEHMKVQPCIATSWSANAGATEWVFKLRKDVVFHNGKTLTPADVVFSIYHHIGPESKSPAKAAVSSIASVKATGPDEVTFVLKSGNADMPYLVSDYHLAMIPENAEFTSTAIGTGPFQLVSFEPGVRARVKRNEHDWNPSRGFVDTVESVSINDRSARMSALLSGSVHLINEMDPSIANTAKKNANIQLFEISGTAYDEYGMFIDTAPFDKNDLRLALKYSVNRPEILKTVLGGHGKIGNDHPIAAIDPNFAADLPQRPYDPDKAKFHFKKSGHDGPITLTIADVAFVSAVEMAQVWQENAKKAGIDLKIDRVPSDGYYDKVFLKAPFCGRYSQGRPTADLGLSLSYLSDARYNMTHWKNPKFDQLLLAARVELDAAKRKQMYHDMQMMLNEEGGSVIPVFTSSTDGASSKIRGFVPSPTAPMAGLRAAEMVWFA